jgi:riboflavin synthase
MFTGLITDIGKVRALSRGGDLRLEIATKYDMTEVAIGASIACSGACLTVIEKGDDWFAVEVSEESISKTTIGDWVVGRSINLERSLRIGEELGGHLVFGHADGIVEVRERRGEGDSIRFIFEAPADLARFIAPKGCVALDGVSLTINEVDGTQFGVNIIPHTADATTMGALAPGDRLNLEVDMLARYVARLLEGGKE